MKIRQMAGGAPMVVVKNRIFSTNIQCVSNLEKYNISYSSDGVDGRWALVNPESKINKISLSDKEGHHKRAPSLTFSFSNNTRPLMGDRLMERRKEDLSFYVLRDDLLHPLVNGNKARKLDAVLPLIEDHAVTDVVTCGGCQSAHAAAVAVSCAERGLKSHLLLRGEQPEILTGYNLISSMYGTVTYVERSRYAKRKEMLMKHADLVAGDSGFVMQLSDILGTSPVARKSEGPILPGDDCGSSITQVEAKSNRRRVVFINEGAGDPIGLFGVIRLVKYLSQNHLFGKVRPIKIVVDAGTGTTAVGIGLGVLCLGLPWEVIGVMLADTIEGYKRQEEHLISDFKRLNRIESFHHELDGDGGIVHWIERVYPRKFGTALNGEVEVCQQIAQQTGILVDPVYTLAAWEHATLLCQREANAEVVMLHTGGTLGMFGMAQRYKSYFKSLQQ